MDSNTKPEMMRKQQQFNLGVANLWENADQESNNQMCGSEGIKNHFFEIDIYNYIENYAQG
jgi:hypothetical protein